MSEPSTELQPHPAQNALALHRELQAVWRSPSGWRGWLSNCSHNDLGLRFMLAAFFLLLCGRLAVHAHPRAIGHAQWGVFER